MQIVWHQSYVSISMNSTDISSTLYLPQFRPMKKFRELFLVNCRWLQNRYIFNCSLVKQNNNKTNLYKSTASTTLKFDSCRYFHALTILLFYRLICLFQINPILAFSIRAFYRFMVESIFEWLLLRQKIIYFNNSCCWKHEAEHHLICTGFENQTV